ncbi:MAG: ion transporter, partial [Phycisphaerales bacterium]|nr:ion transporter [Phycisphaerales bacterium]
PGSLVARCRSLAEASWFQAMVVGVILVAAINVGLETYPQIMERMGPVLLGLDKLIIGIFVVELIIRIGAHGTKPWRFFLSGWNIFDFVVVVVCLIPLGGAYAAVLRLARVLRVLRLITVVPRLRILVTALLHVIPSIIYVTLLLILLFYVYAVMGTVLFRENDPVHFGSLQHSMFSLLRTVTLEDWTDIYYTQSLGSARYPPPGIELYPDVVSRSMPIVAALYFVSFVVVGTMIVLNLFIGVVISSMTEAQAENAKVMLEHQGEGEGVEAQLAAMERQMQDLALQMSALRTSLERQGARKGPPAESP